MAKGAEQAATAIEALQTGGINISILWDDGVLEEIVTSEGFFEKLGRSGIHISMATVCPKPPVASLNCTPTTAASL